MPPMRRHLLFESNKPPFFPPADYHQFSGGAQRAADQEPEAIVVRSPVSYCHVVTIGVYIYIHALLCLVELGVK